MSDCEKIRAGDFKLTRSLSPQANKRIDEVRHHCSMIRRGSLRLFHDPSRRTLREGTFYCRVETIRAGTFYFHVDTIRAGTFYFHVEMI